jgi:hypothetical protein
MALLVAPVLLVAVIGIAVSGRTARPDSGAVAAAPSPAVPAVVAETPYPPAERVNKFTIDDVLGRSSLVTTPPWVRLRVANGLPLVQQRPPTTRDVGTEPYSSQWRSAGWMSGRRRFSQSRMAQ